MSFLGSAAGRLTQVHLEPCSLLVQVGDHAVRQSGGQSGPGEAD